jgi:hypothetical protein
MLSDERKRKTYDATPDCSVFTCIKNMHIYEYIYIYLYICIRGSILSKCVFVYKFMYIYMYIYVLSDERKRKTYDATGNYRVYVYLCTYVYMCVYICIWIFLNCAFMRIYMHMYIC